MASFRVSALLSLAAMLAAAPAMAQQPAPEPPPDPQQHGAARAMSPEARQHLDTAERLFLVQDYARAIEEIQAGYALDPHPDFLYALGQAERLRGNCAAAVRAYRAFLQTSPPEAETARAQANLARCAEQMARERPPPAAAPRVAAAPAAPAPSPPTWRSDWWGHALGLTALAGVGAGATCWFVSNARARDANAAPSLGEYQRQRDASIDFRVASVTAIGVGTAFAVAALVRYAPRSPAAAPSPAVTVMPVGGGALLAGGAAF